MTETNIISIILAVVSYLMIGFIFETHGPSGKFDARTLIFWPFGIDIQIHYWLERRRIQREGDRRLAELVEKRDSSLRFISLQWLDEPKQQALIKMAYGDEITTWRGTCTVWHKVPDGERASTWMESWLCDRWTAARWEKT